MRRTGRTLLAAGAATLALGLAGCGGGGGVDASGAEGRKETAAELARAAQAQKICFGWKLIEGNAGVPVSQGSNLGDAKPVESDPQRCPRWVEVRASYYYTAESDEADDWATFEVATSPDLSVGPTIRRNLERFGLDEKAFVDDPHWAISRAALALPLLAAEAGAAEPAPSPPAAPVANPRPLEPAGSDFWRDRLIFVGVAAAAIVAALLFFLIGLVTRANRPKPSRRTSSAP